MLGPLRHRAGARRSRVRGPDPRRARRATGPPVEPETYTAIRFANRLADNVIAQSMGSVGDSYDNALMENFFSTLKTELVYRKSWRTREDAENALFAYIDG